MSWYAEILGEVRTSLKAKPLVMEVIGDWVELEEDKKEGTLVIRFQDLYRNLGRYVEHEVWKIAQAFPDETEGNFYMYSTDGDFFAASYRVQGGKLFCRKISETEEELEPESFSVAGETVTGMVPKKSSHLAGKLYVLVKNFQGINEDAEVYNREDEVFEAFKKYTGFPWNPHYTNPESELYDEKFSETKIFEVAGDEKEE